MSQINKDRTNWVGVCLLVIGIIYANKFYNWGLFDWHWGTFDWYSGPFGWDFGILNWSLPPEFTSWQAILIGVGLLLVILGRNSGLILMLIGGFFLFTHEFFWAIGHIHQWWPLIFIIIGVSMLAGSTRARKANN